MGNEYRILILEDVDTDTELMKAELRRNDIKYTFEQTDNEEDFKTLIETFQPDIVLSDYSMPLYDGISALRHVLKHSPLTPVIVVTGSINEETAVECMKGGAVDYILKDKLKRLGPAVLKAIEVSKIKQEKEKLQNDLEQREKYYRSILKYMHDEIVVISRDYIIEDINNSVLRITGDKRDDVLGKPCYKVLHGLDSPCFNHGIPCHHGEVLATGIKKRYQRTSKNIDGKERRMDILISPLYDENHTITHVIESYRDITEIVQSRESIIKLSSAVEQSSAATIMLDAKGRVEYVNNAFTVISGYTKEEVLGKSLIMVSCGDISEKERDELYREVMNGEPKKVIFHNKRKDGREYWVSAALAPYTNNEGKIAGIIQLQEDITEQLKNRKQIAEDLKEKDLLLHEVYHRVNNNLQIMISLLNIQSERTGVASEKDILRTSQMRLETMAIIENIIYSGGEFTRVPFDTVITSIFNMLSDSFSIPYGYITLHLEATAPGLTLDRAQPWALIVNELLSNCIKHAYPEGKGAVFVKFFLNSNDQLNLSIRDTGIGLPDYVVPREAETTGLTLVYMLAEGQLGGTVSFSRDGGTSVTVTCRNV